MSVVIKNNQNVPEEFSLLISTPFKYKVLEWATQVKNPLVVTFNRGPWQNASYVNTDTVDITSLEELRDLANSLREMERGRVVIFDGLDDLQGILMTGRLAETRREEFGQSDWNWLAEQTKKIVSGFSNKGHYFVATCSLGHQNGTSKVGLVGSSSWEIPKMMTYTLLYDQTTPEYGVREGEPVISTEGGAFFFRTGPSLQAPWITDYTEVLPLQFFGSMRELAVSYNEYKAARASLMEPQAEVKVETTQPTNVGEAAASPAEVPGMPSDDEIASFFGE